MTLVRWAQPLNPVQDLVTMQEEMNRLVDGVFNPASLRRSRSVAFTPVVDIEETPEAFVIHADLPGVSQKDVKVSLLGDTISIRGQRHAATDRNEANYLRVERVYGAFERSFTLGSPVRADQVKATYRDGVLEIHVPKAEEARMREIDVQVG